uniref:Uncharacterized protein n=1 Tax=Salix viminalis TaxID=40686 RepID=A0A6N2NGX4_SALVM
MVNCVSNVNLRSYLGSPPTTKNIHSFFSSPWTTTTETTQKNQTRKGKDSESGAIRRRTKQSERPGQGKESSRSGSTTGEGKRNQDLAEKEEAMIHDRSHREEDLLNTSGQRGLQASERRRGCK